MVGDWLLVLLVGAPVWGGLLMGAAFVWQMITRGLGSLKGSPLPRGWWMEP